MFGYTSFFGILAGIVSFSAYFFYMYAIIKGYTKPSRSTWFIWAFVGIITAFSYKASGAVDTLWVAISEATAPTIIALLAIKYGVGGLEKIDKIAFLGSTLSLILWWIFGSPLIALITNLAIDLFAAIPTIVKSWKKPEEEDRLAWSITQSGNLLNLFAIDQFNFGVILYPIYTFTIDGIITALLFIPKKIKKQLQKYER